MSEVAVLQSFGLVFAEDGKGRAQLSVETVDISQKNLSTLRDILSDEDWVVVNAAINAIKRVAGKVEREIHREIQAVRNT